MIVNDSDAIPFDVNLPTGFGEFRTGDEYIKNKPKVLELMPNQVDRVGFLSKKNINDPAQAQLITNDITALFGGIQPRTATEGTHAILQTLSVLKQSVSSFPKLLKGVAKGYKLLNPSISKTNQIRDEINMEKLGRGRDKNILEQILGSPDITDDEISILNDYDSMDKLITETSEFI